MTTLEQKETEILGTIKTQTMSGLNTMYSDLVKFDDIFNLQCELGADLRRLAYTIKGFDMKIDEVRIKYLALRDACASGDINSAKASMNGQEVLSKQLSSLEWTAERLTYSQNLLKAKEEAYIDFFAIKVGKKYIPFSSGAIVNTDKINKENKVAKAWLVNHKNDIEPILEGSETIPAIIA
tara:strand:+ start:318 stop:860 length:543 start_codon:yes stop_codon:yes gene_type:complete